MTYIKGSQKDIGIQDRYYAQEAKIKRLAHLVSILWRDVRGGPQRLVDGLTGVRPEECTDGEWTFEKPEHLDCGTLADDLGCQTLDAKPETVELPDEDTP
ncbi:MAG TPA: hypothetical protein EYN66_19075 [Myxococcales bacterium]|nr:hypothetical protein [Myxococcales bacterium]